MITDFPTAPLAPGLTLAFPTNLLDTDGVFGYSPLHAANRRTQE